jgi:multidrug resistance protein, MATE family
MITMKYPVKITKNYLFRLSIPIFFSNLAIPLVGLVDTGLMGHLGNPKFLAATSISTSVITMIFWSFGFLRMGTVGLVAQALGKGDYREIVLTIIRNLTIAVFIGISLICLKQPILFLIDYFFSTSTETKSLIGKYISIRILSAPAELSMYVLVGFYLGMQRTKISSLFISFFCLSNILFSAYFVIFLNLNISGVALGTLLSSYLSIILFLFFTYNFIQIKFSVIPRYKKIFVKKKLLKLFNINFNIFIRTILITFSFLWFTYLSSKMGEDFLAANSILLQFIIFAAFLLDAYAFSTEGVVGYAVGRKVKKSFILAVSNCFQLSFFTSVIISLIYLLFFKEIINLLTNIDYIRFLAFEYLIWIFFIPPLASFCYQFDGIFIGASQSAEIRNSAIISVSLYVLISIFLLERMGNHGIWLSLLIFMLLRSLTLRFYFTNILKKF